MESAKIVVRHILYLIGPKGAATYPTPARNWDVLEERKRREERTPFELIKTFIQFAKNKKDIALLDVLYENKVLTYRFNKLHVKFGPRGNWIANITIVVGGNSFRGTL